MRVLASWSRISLSVLVCLVLLVVIGVPAKGSAASGPFEQPYFKVYGGDTFVGGAFAAKNASGCSGANYQYSTPSTGTDGSIYAFSKSTGTKATGGAGSQYETYTTGQVDGSSLFKYGFYSASGFNPSNYHKLTFANTGSGWKSSVWGGYADGASQQSDCIPDYYDNYVPSTPNNLAYNDGNGYLLSNLTPSGDYTASGTPYVFKGGVIGVGKKINIFVKGNLYITGNILYPVTYTGIPKLSFVVDGNIYIGAGVTRLDGLYIAQSDSQTPTADGVIWTCYNDGSAPLPDNEWYNYAKRCGNQLVINGAVVSRQINFMRVGGDVNKGVANRNEAASSANIAEVINYNPSMVLGGSFFDQANQAYHVDSIISLPPVF